MLLSYFYLVTLKMYKVMIQAYKNKFHMMMTSNVMIRTYKMPEEDIT